jgi:excisionase family DNA binding protein
MAAEILYPVSEVAEMWRCSEDHIMQLIRDGELGIINIAKKREKTRVPESALNDYVRRNLRRVREPVSERAA